MEDRELEQLLKRLLKQDLSKGTDEFREDLLSRCLEVVGKGDVAELSDDDLELLAAAGPNTPLPNGWPTNIDPSL